MPIDSCFAARRLRSYLPLLFLLVLGACQTPKVRASDAMVSANPVQSIAMYGGAQVYWPPTGGLGSQKEAFFGITESRDGLDHVMPMVRTALEEKGYEVLACEPVGAGFYAPNMPSRLVLDVDTDAETGARQDNSLSHSAINHREPLYLYPGLADEPDVQASLRRIFEDLEVTGASPEPAPYAPSPEDIRVVQQASGAGTICILRLAGNAYSSSRKLGDLVLGPLVNGGRHIVDQSILECWLIDGESAEVHWVSGSYAEVRPKWANEDFSRRVWKLLPERGENLDPKHRL